MKTFEFTLSSPVKFHEKGETVESFLLELMAPSAKNRKKIAKLKQGFMRVVGELQNDKPAQKEEKGDHKVKPEEILALLQMGSIDYADYIDIFMDLLTSGICNADGSTSLTVSMAESISFEDIEKLMGEYLVNFILGSMGE